MVLLPEYIRFEQTSEMTKNYILDENAVSTKLQRMAYQIIENNLDEKEIILVGIQENGSAIARNVQKMLEAIGHLHTQLVDLSLNKKKPEKISLSQEIDCNGKVIIIVDDVSNSGKTMLYAMKPFLNMHPKKIQTLALVERTHKAFPVKTDYVGLSLATTLQEHIYVELDGENIKGAWME